ncbi:hypothetical protein [Nonomuraea sp. SYSU D8015]|uniref:hypothetical protein n=1 Tax=Nonomuraea sp. SYSU D8015 TaxID=2593644 RepID=UPI001660F6BF|nr:hypothetical protein [Nonomuraea sp. SYSU D8015]
MIRKTWPAVIMACVLAAGACSAAAPTAPGVRPGVALAALSTDGAVLLDMESESFLGIARNGGRVWHDRTAFQQGSHVICLTRCPEAVFSGGEALDGRAIASWSPIPSGQAAFMNSRHPVLKVLSARSASDAVIAEGPVSGKGRVRVLRTDGSSHDFDVGDAASAVWGEDPGRATALLVMGGDGDALWFARDRHGWRPLPGRLPANQAWGACTASRGELAVLVGPEPVLILERTRRLPIRTDLEFVGECAAGRSGLVVLGRWKDTQGRPHTAVRGVDRAGVQTWARDFATEVQVRAAPSGERFILVHGGRAELVDNSGRTTATYEGAMSAGFTATGELVLVRDGHQVEWLTPPP